MRVFQVFLGIVVFCFVVLMAVPLPVMAASSAAIRAFDDVQADTKNYAGQDLVKAEFANARLANANFSDADLRGAVFNGSILTNANLHSVDFSDGIAYLSDLSGVDLTDAILTSAMMLKSSFRGAKVDGADFSFALLDRDQVAELCKTASGVNPVTGADTRESLGCR
jgi:uncharacterized protein YjbI with pentapeptide repeats